MKDKVVFLSEIDWDFLWQRHQIFAEKYSEKGHDVFYFNKIGMRYPRFNELLYVVSRIFSIIFSNARKSNCPKGKSRLYIRNSLLLPGGARFFNRKILIPMFFNSFRGGGVILHVYQPTELTLDIYNYLKKGCESVTLVYDCVQNFENHPAKTETTGINEAFLFRKSKVAITDSTFLYSKNLNIRNDILLVPPGVDFDMFHSSYRGDEFKSARRILFYGHLRQDNDISLINNLAEQYDMVVVGKVADSVSKLISSKVIVMPAVNYNELPNIMYDFDILLLPYLINNFTDGIIPAKFMECMASGKPIIATKLPSLQLYNELITLVDSDGYFDKLIYSYDDQVKLAAESGWEVRFNSFYNLILK